MRRAAFFIAGLAWADRPGCSSTEVKRTEGSHDGEEHPGRPANQVYGFNAR
jgi:hypothetical protein